jgi:hypothetical protein
MLTIMSKKELDLIPVLQQLCDKRLTQSLAASLLNPVFANDNVFSDVIRLTALLDCLLESVECLQITAYLMIYD